MPKDENLNRRSAKGNKKPRIQNAAKLQRDHLDGKLTEDLGYINKTSPHKLIASYVRDKGNPKSWYIKFVDITPAVNINRPMEPIFNTAFNDNGTNGVPKFVDLETEWIGFADTFMMDQVTYSAMQQVRKFLKSNLTYDEKKIKRCLTNGLALCIKGKMLERDIHWNLYNGSSDFNFAKMFKMQGQVSGTYGIVPLYPISYLLDENLSYTSSIYNKIVSLFNQVIKLPKRVSEFVSHYFGTLFTLDKDGANDQYLRINMHNVDWYNYTEDTDVATIDLAAMTLDEYLSLLNEYSKQFAVVLADLDKCLGVNHIQLLRYESYSYAFVYDKTLLQALINGYTSDSAVKNDFIRLDKMPGVSDDLTQYIFLGGIQPKDDSKASVKAIKILNMLLKVNSDETIKWPKLFDQLPVESSVAGLLKQESPFGISVTTDYVVDDSYHITAISAAESDYTNIPPAPRKTPAADALGSGMRLTFGLGGGAVYPGGVYNFKLPLSANDDYFTALMYLKTLITQTGVDSYIATCIFVASDPIQFADVPESYEDDDSKYREFNKFVYITISVSSVAKIESFVSSLRAVSSNNFWFVHGATVDDALDMFLARVLSKTNLVYIADESPSIDIEDTDSEPDYTFICTKIVHGLDGSFSACIISDAFGTESTIYWQFGPGNIPSLISANNYQVSGINNDSPLPQGLLANRSATLEITQTSNDVTYDANAGGEAAMMYLTQVVDYHIPINYRRNVRLTINWESAATGSNIKIISPSLPTLIKEDYEPYYYNRLDLIPVLYEMFVSLFSIDTIQKR